MQNNTVHAILVDVIDVETPKHRANKRLEELESLVNTYGGIVVIKTIQKRATPDYATYIGSGKVQEIFELGKEAGANLLVLNSILKPRQIFNLEEIFRKANIKVWDRIDLILKIFDKHAQTTEAKLQIELASIEHMGPRIFGMGMELSQQTGIKGLRGGSGEANIEMMKRHLRKQKETIIKKIKHYEEANANNRNWRKRQNFKSAAIVGYTNSGKSTLLHALTGKDVYIADKLFATLDTRIGKLYIQPEQKSSTTAWAKGKEILISDTIGFIQDLPPSLIQAFKSTLAETVESDLIIHVIDIADTDIHKKIEVVEEILAQLGVANKQKLYVFNKIDLIKKLKSSKSNLDEIPERKSGLLPAGRETAKILGWLKTDAEIKESAFASRSPKALQRRYKQFSPVFVSAVKVKNLDKLIKKLDKLC